MIKLCAFADEYSKKLDEQIEALHKHGISLVELRNVDGQNVADISDEKAQEAFDKLSAAGISVWSVGSPLGKTDISADFDAYKRKVHRLCRLANILHTDKIRMFSFYHAYESREQVLFRLNEAVKIAAEYGVGLYHENEKEIYGDTVERVADIMANVKGLKFVYDPANFIQCKQDCKQALETLFDKIDYFHIKDVIAKTQQLVPAGRGDGQIDLLVSKIGDADRVLTVEPHLAIFDGYDKIDGSEMKNAFTYPSGKEAFDAAVSAIKKVLYRCGYIEQNGGYVRDKRIVRYGIIGLGNIGNTHLDNFFRFNNIPNAKVVAIADLKQSKIDSVVKRFPEANFEIFHSGDELIDNADVDAVIVAVPHYSHPALCIRALNKGLNVICEKPAGVFTKQVKEMIEVASHAKGLFTMMFNQRTNCLYRKMRQLVADGEIGTVKRVNWIITDWYRSQSYYDSGDWRATWSGEGGGVLFNQCPHQLDLLWWVTGMMPKSIRAFCHFGKWHDIEVEDDVTAYLEYPNGATGVFVTSTADAPGTNRFEILGTGGKLVCEQGKLLLYKNEVDEREFNRTYKGGFGSPKFTVTEVQTDGENFQHTGICRNFTNAILGKEPLFVDGREGLNSVALMDGMLLSTWLDKTIELPFDDDLYCAELQKRVAVSRRKEGGGDVVLNTEGSFNKH